MIATPEHDKAHDHKKWMQMLAIGSALTLGAVILAPYVLPAVGVGGSALAEESMLALHGAGMGNGLAGALNGMINAIPGIGGALSGGGFIPAATTGIIGIGGVLLGRYIEKHDDGTKRIRWGKVIKTAALITSALIAMPSLLTGISTGIVYLCAVTSGAALASSAVAFMAKTLGSIGTASMAATGLSGAALTLPHLLTCGASVIPACIAWAAGNKKPQAPVLQNGESPIVAGITVNAPTQKDAACKATIILRDAVTKKPLTVEQLAVVHMQKLHLMVIDESLGDYKHIHPQPNGNPGELVCNFTPRTANHYTAWADFTTAGDGKNHQLKMDIPCASRASQKPSVRMNNLAEHNGLRCEWKSDAPLQNGSSNTVKINLTDENGNIVSDLEPVMGAYAHLVGFSTDGKIVHAHPMGMEPKNSGDRGQGELMFHVQPECQGPTQFYLQVKRAGKELFVPFGQEIGRQTAFSGRIIEGRAGGMQPQHAY